MEMPYGVKGVPFPVEEGPLCMFDGETQQVCWGGFLSEFPPSFMEDKRIQLGQKWEEGNQERDEVPPLQLLHPTHRGMGKGTCASWTRSETIFALLFQVHSLLQEAETIRSTPRPLLSDFWSDLELGGRVDREREIRLLTFHLPLPCCCLPEPWSEHSGSLWVAFSVFRGSVSWADLCI